MRPCNKCGNIEKIPQVYIKISHLFGYFSNKDGELHTSYLCEKCYDDLINTFKLEPDKTYNNFWGI